MVGAYHRFVAGLVLDQTDDQVPGLGGHARDDLETAVPEILGTGVDVFGGEAVVDLDHGIVVAAEKGDDLVAVGLAQRVCAAPQ